MNFITRANLKSHARQYVATAIAIIICCVFISAAACLGRLIGWVNDASASNFAQSSQVAIGYDLTGAGSTTQVSMQDYLLANAEELGLTEEMINTYYDDSVSTDNAESTQSKAGSSGDSSADNAGDQAVEDETFTTDSYSQELAEANQKVFQASSTGLINLLKHADQIQNRIPQIKQMLGYYEGWHSLVNGIKNAEAQMSTLMPDPYYRPGVVSGSLPEGQNQIAMTGDYLKILDLKVGDTLQIKNDSYDSGLSSEQNSAGLEVKVVGEIRSDSLIRMGAAPSVYISSDTFKAMQEQYSSAEDYKYVLISTDADPQQVTQQLLQYLSQEKLLDERYYVAVSAQWAEKIKDDARQQAVASQALIYAFPGLATLVCIVIVSVTFTVVLARRRREIALLRCVGATIRQIRRSARLECLSVGLVASVLGAALGWVVCVSVSAYFNFVPSVSEAIKIYGITPVIIPIVVGTAVTWIAGLKPTYEVGKVPPVAALNPHILQQITKKQRYIFRTLGTIICLGLGVALWSVAWTHRDSDGSDDVISGMGGLFLGGVMFLLALLLIGRILLPKVASWLTKPLAKRYPSAQIAGINVSRDPHRTGATATTLLLGIVMVTTIMMGAYSIDATIRQAIDRKYPVDIALEAKFVDQPLTTQLEQELAQVPAVTDSSVGQGITIKSITDASGNQLDLSELTGVISYDNSASQGTDQGAAEDQNATADQSGANGRTDVSTDFYFAIAPPANLNQLAHQDQLLPQPGEMLVPKNDAVGSNISGDQTTWQVTFNGGQTRQLKVRVVEDLAYSASEGNWSQSGRIGYLSTADLQELSSAGSLTFDAAMYMRTDHSSFADTYQTVTTIYSGIGNNYLFGGGFIYSAIITVTLTVLMVVLLCLVGVSALVALVGVANTLSLSVVDRAQENALLRALGFTRKQIKRMLTIESLLMGAVSLIVGGLVSLLFVWFGLMTLPFGSLVSTKEDLAISIPWWGALGIIGVIIGCCYLAAILPGRRASKASPVAALASADQ